MSNHKRNLALAQLDEIENWIKEYRQALNDELSLDAKIALYEEIDELYTNLKNDM